MATRKKRKNCMTFVKYMELRQKFPVMPSIDEMLSGIPIWGIHVNYSLKKERKRTSSKRTDDGSRDYTCYRFKGYPTQEQEHMLCQNIGSARFIWNAMLRDYKTDLDAGVKPTVRTPASYKIKEGLGWLNDMDSYALCNAQLNLEGALSDFRKGGKGFPNFKKKHLCVDSYTTNKDSRSNNISFNGKTLKLPKIPGEIRLKAHRKVREGGVLKSCTVTREPDGKWYFALKYEYPAEDYGFSENINTAISTGSTDALIHTGLDMSLPFLFIDLEGNTPSYVNDGVMVEFKKAYRKLESRITKEQRKLSRMQKGSNNYNKQLVKTARLYARAKHQRQDFLHQLSARLTDAYDIITIEDLDLSAIKQSLKFGKSVSDNGWGMFVEMLYNKSYRKGTLVIKTDRWFPSSRTCIKCGYVNRELELSDRTYICPVCGNVMGRDRQAAQNLDNEGLRIFTKTYLTRTKHGAA